MFHRKPSAITTVLACIPLFVASAAFAADPPVPKLAAVINGAHRDAAQKARDVHRHPIETLTFFGIKDNQTVVELWPFGGWYTAILAPYLREHGKYYAAAIDPDTKNEREQSYNKQLKALLDSHPELYDKVVVSALAPGKLEIAPAGTADLVVSFRNIHNWQWAGIDKAVFAEAFKALKPGGVLGIVEHRANPDMAESNTPGNAYVKPEYAIALIESVGFKLIDTSEINANPKDTKDHPRGVWTLPPGYALGDQDRDKYTAIGESDRFTMKFMKPAN